MPRIQLLSASVINKIAAGEVIERPASAVKELLENSVDALATRIEVDVVAGGMELIRIVDDGEGIHPDDMPLAVSSHATSKIRAADDLFDVRTFGFRGEALASMAEVSRFRLRSRQSDQTHGCELEVIHGALQPLRECGCPVGTSIEIRNLFENVPVRRKFLKTASTEFGQITEQFTRVALANPRLHLVLRHNDRVVYQLPPVERPIDRLQTLFGDDLAEQLIAIESQHAGVRLWGYVGHPSVSKSTRKQQYLFLNGRWIQDRSLQHALTEAYRGLLMVGRQPVAFLFFELPTDRVDVNVHPTKSEVRFQDGQQLFRQLLSTLRSKFLSLDLQSTLTLPQQPALTDPLSPMPRPTPSLTLQTEFANWATTQLSQWSPDAPPALTDAADRGIHEVEGGDAVWQRRSDQFQSTAVLEEPSEAATASTDSPAPVANANDVPVRAMQIHDCYIVVETSEGMTVIDQHALHERILYEQFRQRVLSGVVESQRLLMPVPVEVSAKEAALLLEQTELLNRLGVGVEEFGKDTVILTKHPVLLRKHDLSQLVRDLAESLEGSGSASPTRRDLLDELLHMMSCKAAVKAGQRLTPEEIDSLLLQGHLVDDAHHCPHGRPTALKLSRAELDRQFGRLG